MANITVIILTKNEEKNIKASIKSAKQIADRIIIVDSGSDDNTVDIAKKLGQKLTIMNGVDMQINLIGH